MTAPSPSFPTPDSPEIFSAALGKLGSAARLAILQDPMTVQDHPGWLLALHQAGFFEPAYLLDNHRDARRPAATLSPAYSPFSAASAVAKTDKTIQPPDLIYGETARYSALIWALTTPSKKQLGNTQMVDPDTGDVLTLEQLWQHHAGWTLVTRQAFSAIVADFLSAALKRTEQSIFDTFPSQAALLMCAACAGGDAASAAALYQAFPQVLATPMSTALMTREKGLDNIKISPVLLAVKFNQRPVLEALKAAGWDPLSTLLWTDGASSPNLYFLDTASPTVRESNLFKVIDADPLRGKNSATSDGWRPHMLDFFFEEFMAKPSDKKLAGGHNWLCNITHAMIEMGADSPFRGSLIRCGVVRHFANDVVDVACTKADMQILQALRPGIHWPDYPAKNFPCCLVPLTPEGKDAALNLARWCVEDGHRDMLLSPGTDGLNEKSNLAIPHHFASKGFSEMIHFMLAQGLDPLVKSTLSGLSVIEEAELAGQHQVAGLLRSHLARKELRSIIDGESPGLMP